MGGYKRQRVLLFCMTHGGPDLLLADIFWLPELSNQGECEARESQSNEASNGEKQKYVYGQLKSVDFAITWYQPPKSNFRRERSMRLWSKNPDQAKMVQSHLCTLTEGENNTQRNRSSVNEPAPHRTAVHLYAAFLQTHTTQTPHGPSDHARSLGSRPIRLCWTNNSFTSWFVQTVNALHDGTS